MDVWEMLGGGLGDAWWMFHGNSARHEGRVSGFTTYWLRRFLFFFFLLFIFLRHDACDLIALDLICLDDLCALFAVFVKTSSW